MIKKGFLLISAMIMVVLLIIAVLGVSFFITERSRYLSVQESYLKSFYFAESGVHKALYEYRQTGCSLFGSHQIEQGQTIEISGDYADLVTVDASDPDISVSNFFWFWDLVNISDVYLDSVVSGESPVLERIRLDWSNTSMRLYQIRIDGNNVWSGYDRPPVNCNISDIAFNCPTTRNLSLLFITTSVQADTITAQFFMSDGSSKERQIYPASDKGSFSFISTGQIEREFTLSTGVQAEYDVSSEQVINYEKE